MLKVISGLAAVAAGLALAPAASAASFAYDLNSTTNVDDFADRFLHGLANRASFAGGAYMRVKLVPYDGNLSPENLTEDTIIESTGVQAAELIYRVRFSSNFEFERQGKLPGIASFQPHYGGNASDPPAKDSWSHRLMWFPGTPEIKRPDMYIYDQNRVQGSFGTHTTASSSFALAKNTWYRIRMVTILNTISNGVANSNGKTEMWVNEVRAVCRDGLKLRGNNSTNTGLIGKLAFHVYHGGGKTEFEMPSSPDTFVDFDYFNYNPLSTSGISRSC